MNNERIKTKITSIIEVRGHNKADKIEFEQVENYKEADIRAIITKINELENLDISLNVGDEIELEKEATGFKILFQKREIGRIPKNIFKRRKKV